jgi:hypothetical protein
MLGETSNQHLYIKTGMDMDGLMLGETSYEALSGKICILSH